MMLRKKPVESRILYRKYDSMKNKERTILIRTKSKDDLTEAVRGLDIFCKNFCTNVEKTKEIKDLIFRCDECPFNVKENFINDERDVCLIKKFAVSRGAYHQFPMALFGSMGEL